VLLAEAPADKEAVGEALSVLLPLVVEEGVGAEEPVPVPVPEAEGLLGGVCEGEGVLVRLLLPVLLAVTPVEIDAVAESDTVAHEEGVPVGDGDRVALPVLVADGEVDPVTQLEGVPDPVEETLEPGDAEVVDVAEADGVMLDEGVPEGLNVGVPLPVVDGETVTGPVGDGVAVVELDTVEEAVSEPV
jgi:hypothetical protein